MSLKPGQQEGHRPPPQRSMRRRLLVTFGCALTLLFAVSGLLLSTQPDPTEALGSLIGLPTSTPTAPLPLDASLFFVAHRVPWGELTIDGKRNDALDITQLPDGDPLDNPVSIFLSRGHHRVVYDAPPFTALRCVVSVPASAHDTCPLDQPDAQTRSQIVGGSRILDLSATLDHLPTQPLADLVAAATAAIDVSTPVVAASAGDHYLGNDLQTHTFIQDVRVSVFREPWRGAPAAGLTACQFLCPGSQSGVTPSSVWALTAQVREGYHYVPVAAGAPSLADGPLAWTPESFKQPQRLLLDSVPLDVTWDGTWHVMLETFNGQEHVCQPSSCPALVCQAASGVLANYIGASSGPTATATATRLEPMVPAVNQADGCAVGVQLMNPDGTKGATGALLYRFGALLTTDSTSRTLFPQVPQADSAEQALAQQILAHAS